ncbi:MAG TPA: hypothetical protein PKL83_00920 [bacterium]|nr:hypothetical protein [bacterium]
MPRTGLSIEISVQTNRYFLILLFVFLLGWAATLAGFLFLPERQERLVPGMQIRAYSEVPLVETGKQNER